MNSTKTNTIPETSPLFNVAAVRQHLGKAHELEKSGFKVRVQISRLSEANGRDIKMQHELATAMRSRSLIQIVKTRTQADAQPFFKMRDAQLAGCKKQVEAIIADTTGTLRTAEREAQLAACTKQAEQMIINDVKEVRTVEELTIVLMTQQLMRQSYVSPFGGSAQVTITTPSGKQYTGASHCHIVDSFERKTAVGRAWGSLFRNMLLDTPLPEKHARKSLEAVIAGRPTL